MEITAMRIGTAMEESENDQRTCLWITPVFPAAKGAAAATGSIRKEVADHVRRTGDEY